MQEIKLQELNAQSTMAQERLAFNSAIGCPSDRMVFLENDLVPQFSQYPPVEILFKEAETKRLDLLAIKLGYESQEARVRAAVNSQFPNINIGLTGGRDTDSLQTVGVGLSIDIPFFDRNQGRIAEERASRQQLFDEYNARIFEMHADIDRLATALEAARKQLSVIDESLSIQRNLVENYHRAVDAGQADIFLYYEMVSSLYNKQIQRIEQEQRMFDLGIALEIASGHYGIVSTARTHVQTTEVEDVQMNRVLFIFLIVIAVIVLAVLHKWQDNGKVLGSAANQIPINIQTATPQQKDFTETCRWFGRVESANKLKVISLETGRIAFIAAKDEIPVKRGELLFTIGGPLINIHMDGLRNQSAIIQKRINSAKQIVAIKLDAVTQKFAKYEELVSAKDALFRLKADMVSISQEIQQIEESIYIRAGADGVFTSRKVSIGQDVQKGDDLAEIISQDHIYIEGTLFPKGDEVELEKKRVVINLPEGNSIQGTITTVLPQRTTEGASVVWIEGPDLVQALHPGQTAAGTIILSTHEKTLAVPQDAIVRDDEELAYVFLKDFSGYRKQPVKTGIVADGLVEIVSGLKEGDEVVVRGAYELFYRDFNRIYKVVD